MEWTRIRNSGVISLVIWLRVVPLELRLCASYIRWISPVLGNYRLFSFAFNFIRLVDIHKRLASCECNHWLIIVNVVKLVITWLDRTVEALLLYSNGFEYLVLQWILTKLIFQSWIIYCWISCMRVLEHSINFYLRVKSFSKLNVAPYFDNCKINFKSKLFSKVVKAKNTWFHLSPGWS